MPTISGSRFTPPKSWEELELLLLDLFRNIWSYPYAQRNGRGGQSQQGVDIWGRRGPKWEGVQAKGKNENYGSTVSDNELRQEVLKAREFKPSLSHFTLVTTAPRNAKLQTTARQLTETQLSQGFFSVTVWGWEDVEEQLAPYPDVVRRHYQEYFISPKEQNFEQEKVGLLANPEGLIKGILRKLVSEHGEFRQEEDQLPKKGSPPQRPALYVERGTVVDKTKGQLVQSPWVAIVGSTGTGKSQLARSIFESVTSGQRYWISFQSHENRYESHLDEQLLLWDYLRTLDMSKYQGYRSGSICGEELAALVVPGNGRNILLVLDDLPQMDGPEMEGLRLRLGAVTQ